MLRASRSIQTERLHRRHGFRDYARNDEWEGLGFPPSPFGGRLGWGLCVYAARTGFKPPP